MLKLIYRYQDLPMEYLMEIYGDMLASNDAFRVRQEFYSYLQDSFFHEGGVYALWQADGRPTAAVRLEKWKDGILLAGLETKPASRNKGYAKALLQGVLDALEQQKIPVVYSHVHKKNRASMAVHEACGFKIQSECARFLDGSVLSTHFTLVKKFQNGG